MRPKRAAVVAERARSGGYAAVVLAATATGKDLAPRVAAKLGVGLAGDVTDLAVEGGAVTATRPVYAGKALLRVKVTGLPVIVSLRPNVFTAVERPRAGAAETVAVATPPGRVTVREIKAAAGVGRGPKRPS
jgi:electron transfer flavoprotein alpha subunit